MLMEPASDPLPEAILIRRARRGETQAFEALYTRHARAVHALAWRLTGDAGTAQDITQDTFLRMFGFLSGLKDDRPLRPWLKRVAANLAIDHLRQQWRTTALDDQLLESAWSPALQQDQAADLDTLLRRLPAHVRTVVWLHEVEGWSHEDLADRFRRSPSWSKSLLARALARLRSDHGDPS